MAYNNYGGRSYGSNRRGGGYSSAYSGGGYQRSNNRYNGGGSSQGSGKKKSGCTTGIGKNNQPYVRGWKASRRFGMTTFFAAPYKGTHSVESKNGNTWENWILKIQYENGQEKIKPCLYSPQTKRVICQDLGLVMNPKGGRGGYTGRFYSK